MSDRVTEANLHSRVSLQLLQELPLNHPVPLIKPEQAHSGLAFGADRLDYGAFNSEMIAPVLPPRLNSRTKLPE